ncbi:MAG: hypothetical protein ABI862_07890 [Ilumatobacteraceae bacterium]
MSSDGPPRHDTATLHAAGVDLADVEAAQDEIERLVLVLFGEQLRGGADLPEGLPERFAMALRERCRRLATHLYARGYFAGRHPHATVEDHDAPTLRVTKPWERA